MAISRREALVGGGAVLGGLALLGCSGSLDGKADAERAVVDFHRLLDAGSFSRIYAASHAEFKKASAEKDFVALLEAIQRKLGPVVSSAALGWNIKRFNLDLNVHLGYKTNFAHGEADESFLYRIDNSKASLLAYNINSLALMTK